MKKSNKIERKCAKCCSFDLDLILMEDNTFMCQPCLLKKSDSMRTEFFPEINKITDKIYLGNSDGSREKSILKNELGVSHILVCGRYLLKHHPDDFIYKEIPADDNEKEKINKYFEETNNFIESANCVYVHCAAGVSRSATIVIAYLIWKHKISFDEALKIVKEKRPMVSPNFNFEKQLRSYSKQYELF